MSMLRADVPYGLLYSLKDRPIVKFIAMFPALVTDGCGGKFDAT